MSESFREEITRLEALYAGDPGGRVFTHLAEAYRKAGELSRAREILDRGLRDHDDYASASVVLGRVLMDMGQTEAARAAFCRVIELDRHNLVALRSLGDLAIAAHDTGEGLRHYRELLALDPTDELVRATIARLESTGLAEPVAVTDAGNMEQDASAGGMEPNASGDDVDVAVDSDLDHAAIPEPGEMVTETMAELYAAQGLHVRAADVYRSLLRARPGDERLDARLRREESLIAGAERRRAHAPLPRTAEYAAAGPLDETPGWLEHVESAWTGGSGVAGARPTPYAWTEMAQAARTGDEAEERPISAYFESLLAWRPGALGPPRGETPGDEGGTVEDDEDLEMFRSWLQRLKT